MSENDNDEGGINITLGKLIAYPVGVLLILSGLGGLTSSLLGGVLILLSGVLALPIARSRLKDQTGVGLNRWAASAIVLVLMFAGAGAISAASTGDVGADNAGSNSGNGVQLIEQPATDLAPTIEDFETGWRGGVEDGGTARYSNVEDNEVVLYNITVYESVDEAQSELESRQPDNTATSNPNIADGGFMYPLSDEAYSVQIRERNVICKTTYQGGIATFDVEGNAESFAQTCADAINE